VLHEATIDEAAAVLEENDVEAARRHLRAEAKSAPAPAPGAPEPQGLGDGEGAAAASSSSSEPARKPLPEGCVDGATARQYLPKAQGCSLSVHGTERYQVYYRARSRAPRSYSITFDGEQGISHREALARCLAWAWGVHAQEHPEAAGCPYTLPEVPV